MTIDERVREGDDIIPTPFAPHLGNSRSSQVNDRLWESPPPTRETRGDRRIASAVRGLVRSVFRGDARCTAADDADEGSDSPPRRTHPYVCVLKEVGRKGGRMDF